MDILSIGSRSMSPSPAPRKRDASHIISDDEDDGAEQSTASKRKKTGSTQWQAQHTTNPALVEESKRREENVWSYKPLPSRTTNTTAIIAELNEEIKDALYGNIYDEEDLSEGIHDNQIGTTIWTRNEKLRFFNALAIYGRDDIRNIAAAVGKSMPETRAYLLVLEDATLEYKVTVGEQHASLDMRSVPAAVELSKPLIRELSRAAIEIEQRKMRLEEKGEQRKYGRYWLLDSKIAKEVYEAYRDVEPIEKDQRRRAAEDTDRQSKNNSQNQSDDRMELDKEQSAFISVKQSASESSSSVTSNTSVDSNDKESSESNDQGSEEETTSADDSDSSISDTDLNSSVDISQEPSEQYIPEILRRVPAANLLNLNTLLRMSNHVFMNPPSQKAFFMADKAIRHTAFADLHAIIVSLTRRLLSVAIFQANTRIRLRERYLSNKHQHRRKVMVKDVLAALDILNIKKDAFDFWRNAPRRLGLTCRTSKRAFKLKYEDHLPPLSDISLRQAEDVLSKRVWRKWHPDFKHKNDIEETPEDHEDDQSEESVENYDDNGDEGIATQSFSTMESQLEGQNDDNSHLTSSEDEATLSASKETQELQSISNSPDSLDSTSSSDSDSDSNTNSNSDSTSSFTPSELASLSASSSKQTPQSAAHNHAEHAAALVADLTASATEEALLEAIDAAAAAAEEERLWQAVALRRESRAERQARLAAERASRRWAKEAGAAERSGRGRGGGGGGRRKGLYSDPQGYVKRLLAQPFDLAAEEEGEFLLGPDGRPVVRDGRPVRLRPEALVQGRDEIVDRRMGTGTTIMAERTGQAGYSTSQAGPSTSQAGPSTSQATNTVRDNRQDQDQEKPNLKFLDPDQSSRWRDVVDYRAPWENECIKGETSIPKSRKAKKRV